MKNTIVAAACVLALAGCGGTAVRDKLAIQDPTVLQTGFATEQSRQAGAAERAWTDVYGQIDSPREILATLQTRLGNLGPKKENYFGYKHQCWIDVAGQERDAGNGWGFVEEAVGESARLTAGLEGAQPLSGDNPPLRTVARVRPDLAATLKGMRGDARFGYCPQAQRSVACMEVKLMHAGHDAWARSFDAAQAKVEAVERGMAEARQQLDGCAVPQVEAPPPPKVVTLSADALFAFDGGDIAAITQDGRSKLDAVTADVMRSGDLTSITVAGYTDRLGSAAYNRDLSERRALSVQRYLQGKGVTVPIQARGYGPASPGSDCRMKDRRALIECLAADRRVELRFTRKGETAEGPQ